MAYDQQPGQDGQQGQWPGGDGRWQPPEWRDGQGNGQRGYVPGQTQSYFQPAAQPQPGQPAYGPPQPGYGPPPPTAFYGAPPHRGKSWPARHKVLTGVLGLVALVIIIVAAGSGGSSGSRTPTGLTTSASATATGTPGKHATQAAAVTHKAQPKKTTPAVPAASHAPAAPGPASTTDAPAAPAPATRAAAAAPPTTQAAVVPPPPSSAAPAGCTPLTNGGKCYEPGEFCRAADHGAAGVAGDGEAITCQDNDGWRWEPS